ncbi:testis-specific Y-encoded-like protein 1 [Sphaerodactylus townsendi]|uniref:testis-specific Y-encoded-like protein 1 n=1 Tax=Sphaerodactylus townsendi TaxID=933632 RepID=UPI0020274B24|nr:testis-specific Y-encoded-like protein 1 [Sphaerodactylus townsendi]
MSGDGGDWDPPASKQQRLDSACQSQKETEAAQALADMTAWGRGRRENAAGRQGAPETAAAGSLETAAGRQGAPEATSWGSLETAARQGAPGTTAAADHPSPPGRADGKAEQPGDGEGGKEGELETAARRSKGGLETTKAEEDEEAAGDHREGRRKRKEARERRRAAERAAAAVAAAEDECSIISVGEDEDEEDGGGRGAPTPPPKMEQYLEELEAVQLELEAVNQQASRAFTHLKAKFGHMRRPHLERRNRIVQNIPGFWVTAVSSCCERGRKGYQ